MLKFKYGLGDTGYGYRGIDGSLGNTGETTYFSTLSGVSDASTITYKLTNNFILSTSENLLPGYPDRIYRNGDYFIDLNLLMYHIDFTNTDNYVSIPTDTLISSFFKEQIETSLTGYTRWSNLYLSDINNNQSLNQKIIDVVYTSTDSSQYRSDINLSYVAVPDDFTQIMFTDASVTNGFGNSYWPFNLMTTGTKSMALVTDLSTNWWHWGSKDPSDNSLDNSNLALDFTTVEILGSVDVSGHLIANVTGSSGSVITNDSSDGTISSANILLTFNSGISTPGTPLTLWEDTGLTYDTTSATATTTTWTSTSDDRLKENFIPFGPVLAKIIALSGSFSHFDWIDRKIPGVGYSAQTLKKIFPEFVRPVKSAGGKMVINYDKLSGVALQGITELDERYILRTKNINDRLKKLNDKIELIKNKNGIK